MTLHVRCLVWALSGLLGLAGCASPNLPLVPTPTVTSSTPDLAAQREQAGIPDCPETDLAAEQTAGGLPALVLECLGSDRSVNLAGLRGKPMVVNVWAQWCPPCRQEAPALGRYAAAVKGEVLVLGIDYDDPDPEVALQFAAAAGWAYPQLVDPVKQSAGPLQLNGIPVTLFVDADGVVVHRYSGALDDSTLASLSEQYLGVPA